MRDIAIFHGRERIPEESHHRLDTDDELDSPCEWCGEEIAPGSHYIEQRVLALDERQEDWAVVYHDDGCLR
jgi:hypothetical protein